MRRAEWACLLTWLIAVGFGLGYHLSWLGGAWGGFWTGWWLAAHRAAERRAEGSQKALDQMLRARADWYPYNPVSERHTLSQLPENRSLSENRTH